MWEPGPNRSSIDPQLVQEWVWCSCISCASMLWSWSRVEADGVRGSQRWAGKVKGGCTMTAQLWAPAHCLPTYTTHPQPCTQKVHLPCCTSLLVTTGTLRSHTIQSYPHLFCIITPIDMDHFKQLLHNHPNSELVVSVCQGLRSSFWPFAITKKSENLP